MIVQLQFLQKEATNSSPSPFFFSLGTAHVVYVLDNLIAFCTFLCSSSGK